MTTQNGTRCGSVGHPLPAGKLLHGTASGGDGAQLERIGQMFSRRLETDPETVERDVTLLVLTLVELFRQTMERQALARVDELPDDQVDRVGRTLMLADRRLGELCDAFGVTRADLTRGVARLSRLV